MKNQVLTPMAAFGRDNQSFVQNDVCNVHRLFEQPARVVSQVQDKPFDLAFFLKVLKRFAEFGTGRGKKIHDPDIRVSGREQFCFCRVQGNFFPDQRDILFGGAVWRHNRQIDSGPLTTAYLQAGILKAHGGG